MSIARKKISASHPDPSVSVTILHPRSAVGFDDSGKWLLLVVVYGRQPGFSEGIFLYELALLFRTKGCTQSINLDGGGSSIMLIQKPSQEAETVNRPSGLLHRPVPVMLGIRKKIE
jgi:exopolysaccharide biosynthesis protein